MPLRERSCYGVMKSRFRRSNFGAPAYGSFPTDHAKALESLSAFISPIVDSFAGTAVADS